MSQNAHPTRSPEFLSRLHDGDLDPGERAHFEAHRAHCVECRTAAAEFEAALSLYRSSRPAPASPDLAARILRKLQARSGRRPFFGATFGIDLRWAGAFAAAVIAAIVGSSIVAKNEDRERAMREPIPVEVRSAPAARLNEAPADPAPQLLAKEKADESAALRDRAGATAGEDAKSLKDGQGAAGAANGYFYSDGLHDSRNKKLSASPAEEAERQKARKREQARTESDKETGSVDAIAAARERQAPSSADSERKPQALQSPPVQQAPPPAAPAQKSAGAAPPSRNAPAAAGVFAQDPSERRAEAPASQTQNSQSSNAQSPPLLDRSGGEGGNNVAGADIPAPAPVRVTVESLDGSSSVPALVASSTAGIPESLRGHSFIVVVDAAGRVRQARPRPTGNRRLDRDESAAKAVSPPGLLDVRFEPGDRQRRLLLRIE